MPNNKITSFIKNNRGLLIALLVFILMPFIVGLFDGASPVKVWMNESGQSKFIQGLAIEIFILALFALSYDLIFGFTGLLSFGHSMFFAVGAYLTGIMLKNFGLSLGATFGILILASIIAGIAFRVGPSQGQRDNLRIGNIGDGVGLPCIGYSPPRCRNLQVQTLGCRV